MAGLFSVSALCHPVQLVIGVAGEPAEIIVIRQQSAGGAPALHRSNAFADRRGELGRGVLGHKRLLLFDLPASNHFHDLDRDFPWHGLVYPQPRVAAPRVLNLKWRQLGVYGRKVLRRQQRLRLDAERLRHRT